MVSHFRPKQLQGTCFRKRKQKKKTSLISHPLTKKVSKLYSFVNKFLSSHIYFVSGFVKNVNFP